MTASHVRLTDFLLNLHLNDLADVNSVFRRISNLESALQIANVIMIIMNIMSLAEDLIRNIMHLQI